MLYLVQSQMRNSRRYPLPKLLRKHGPFSRQPMKEPRLSRIQSFCNVEFYQPSCWLYSVPNFLVFQQLVTLYLGGILVKVVSEIVCKKNRDSRLDLMGDLRLQAARSWTRARHARSWSVMSTGVLQDKIGQLAVQLPRGWNSRLSQAASQPCFEFSPQYKHPFYPERILREKP